MKNQKIGFKELFVIIDKKVFYKLTSNQGINCSLERLSEHPEGHTNLDRLFAIVHKN